MSNACAARASDLLRAIFQLNGFFTDYGPDYTSFEDGRIAGGFARSDKRSAKTRAAERPYLMTLRP